MRYTLQKINKKALEMGFLDGEQKKPWGNRD